MNLVNMYMKETYLEGYGLLSKVKIASCNNEKTYYSLPELEQGKVYSVSKIKKCTGSFKCAQTCTTGCCAIMINIWDKKNNKEVSMGTCGCILLSESGTPLFEK